MGNLLERSATTNAHHPSLAGGWRRFELKSFSPPGWLSSPGSPAQRSPCSDLPRLQPPSAHLSGMGNRASDPSVFRGLVHNFLPLLQGCVNHVL